MCGIYGIINLDGAPADTQLLSAMAGATRHRGPDDEGYHVYGAIWSPEMVQFYVDDVSNVFFVITASRLPRGGRS